MYEVGGEGHKKTQGRGLVYHHLDPLTKEHGIRSMVEASEQSLQAEVDKCVPVCEMSHRVVHFVDGKWGKKKQRTVDASGQMVDV